MRSAMVKICVSVIAGYGGLAGLGLLLTRDMWGGRSLAALSAFGGAVFALIFCAAAIAPSHRGTSTIELGRCLELGKALARTRLAVSMLSLAVTILMLNGPNSWAVTVFMLCVTSMVLLEIWRSDVGAFATLPLIGIIDAAIGAWSIMMITQGGSPHPPPSHSYRPERVDDVDVYEKPALLAMRHLFGVDVFTFVWDLSIGILFMALVQMVMVGVCGAVARRRSQVRPM